MFRALMIAALSLLPSAATAAITAKFAAENSPYTGLCPGILKFAGTISGPANQSVTYVFHRTIKRMVVSTLPVTAALDGTGHLNVSDSFSVDASQAGAGADELQVLPSIRAKADFTIKCSNPIAMNSSTPRPHVFIAEGSYPIIFSSPHPFDYSRNCGTLPRPPGWVKLPASTLKLGYTAEKAYHQEKDHYGSPAAVGFSPEAQVQACVHFVVTLGHYSDWPNIASMYFITAQHYLGGPMYCITDVSGTTPAGTAAVAARGGPILTPEACAALPPAM